MRLLLFILTFSVVFPYLIIVFIILSPLLLFNAFLKKEKETYGEREIRQIGAQI